MKYMDLNGNYHKSAARAAFSNTVNKAMYFIAKRRYSTKYSKASSTNADNDAEPTIEEEQIHAYNLADLDDPNENDSNSEESNSPSIEDGDTIKSMIEDKVNGLPADSDHVMHTINTALDLNSDSIRKLADIYGAPANISGMIESYTDVLSSAVSLDPDFLESPKRDSNIKALLSAMKDKISDYAEQMEPTSLDGDDD